MSDLPWWVQGREAVIAATDPSEWRDAVAPDYELSHEFIPAERTHQFEPDSLEAIVERVVQVFELEVTYKDDPATWVSTVTERFRTNVNGGEWATPADIVDVGSYNLFIGDSLFYPAGESFDSSHNVFHTALSSGFFWEVLEVLTGPPVVTFKWRHWGKFSGEYKGVAPTGETIEMFGVTVAKVNDDLRLLDVEHFYDPNQLLSKLAGGCPVAKS